MESRESVPCNGCTACCKNERVVLYPEHGDIIERYETVPATLPVGLPSGVRETLDVRPGARMLPHKPNGDCFYLGENGCTIWDKAPAMCRAFDCRKWFLRFNRNQRRQLLARGHLDLAVVQAARDRLHTLNA